MNAGIQWRQEYESAGLEEVHSWQWFVDTSRMMERGWRFFCRKRGWDPRKAMEEDCMTPDQRNHADAMSSIKRQR